MLPLCSKTSKYISQVIMSAADLQYTKSEAITNGSGTIELMNPHVLSLMCVFVCRRSRGLGSLGSAEQNPVWVWHGPAQPGLCCPPAMGSVGLLWSQMVENSVHLLNLL